MSRTFYVSSGMGGCSGRLAVRAGVCLAVGVCCLGVLVSTACRTPPPTEHRHVLLLTVDTLRADHLFRTVQGHAISPYLDQLVSSGVRFENAVAAAPRTTQSLASLLTGRYPQSTGVRTLTDELPDAAVSVAEIAQESGYHTVAVVSNHILRPERGLGQGFDVYDFAGDIRDAEGTTDAVLSAVSRFEASDPLFLWVHYIDPHVPYYPPPEIAIALDPDYEGPYRLHFGTAKGGVGNRAYPPDLPKIQAVYQNPLSDEVNAHVRRLYAADIRFTDLHIERLVSSLQRDFGDDWLVIFAADHGESLGEHGYHYDHGDYVYNTCIRVPLALVFPTGRPPDAPAVIHPWVSLVDVMPTMCELLGFELEPDHGQTIDGRSLMPLLRGEEAVSRMVFAESGKAYFPGFVGKRKIFNVKGKLRTLIRDGVKIIWIPGQTPDLEWEVYDLVRDPEEAVNLHDPMDPVQRRMQGALLAWAAGGVEGSGILSAADRDALRALGYLDDAPERRNLDEAGASERKARGGEPEG